MKLIALYLSGSCHHKFLVIHQINVRLYSYINLKITANNNSLVRLMKLDGQCVWERDRQAARNMLSSRKCVA